MHDSMNVKNWNKYWRMYTYISETPLYQLIMSIRHASTLKGPYSGSTNDTLQEQGQQNESPGVKFNLVRSV